MEAATSLAGKWVGVWKGYLDEMDSVAIGPALELGNSPKNFHRGLAILNEVPWARDDRDQDEEFRLSPDCTILPPGLLRAGSSVAIPTRVQGE